MVLLPTHLFSSCKNRVRIYRSMGIVTAAEVAALPNPHEASK